MKTLTIKNGTFEFIPLVDTLAELDVLDKKKQDKIRDIVEDAIFEVCNLYGYAPELLADYEAIVNLAVEKIIKEV